MYVGDFCICFRSKNIRTIERHLQQCLNRIEDWATRNGFKFSKSRTQCVHFCQQRKVHNDPALYIYGSQIPVVAESKFLGVIFDRKLSFIPHIKYVKAKCLKVLNLLKVLSHTSWGADRTTLLHLYRSLIRSKLDYGSIVYGLLEKLIYRCNTLYIIKDFVWHWELFVRLQYRVLMWKQMSHRYGYAERKCLFSMPSDLLLTLLTLLLKSHFHHNFRNIMKENLTQLNPSAFV